MGSLPGDQAKAYFPPDVTSGSPTENTAVPEHISPLDPVATLNRIHAILASLDVSVQVSGR
jgi:hypothetical protein